MLNQDRERMVATQIEARGITDPLVLDAMRTVPRERFLPASLAKFAHDDGPLPIRHDQTISQPYIVAVMARAAGLKPGARVLEIGTGSGYGAAVLSRIAPEVHTVERVGALADVARARLAELGYGNVHVREGDGTLGWSAHAPYDAGRGDGGRRPGAGDAATSARGGRSSRHAGRPGRPPPASGACHPNRCARIPVRESGRGRVRPLIGAEGWTEGG
jgi:protein-L-isoaspartate(D-aspartate) O-methyltransferase